MFDIDDLNQLKRPTIAKKPWMTEKIMSLVTTETLTEVIDECIASGLYAIDLETTGLDSRVYDGRTNDKIVGVCLSPDGVKGYYIPILHTEHLDKCIPMSQAYGELRRLEASPAVAIFHNGKFDHEFLQFNGGESIGLWDNPAKWEDSLIIVALASLNLKSKRLKGLSKMFLRDTMGEPMEMIELHELFSDAEAAEFGMNFGVLDPSWEPAIWYGCSDAICTYLLYKMFRDKATARTDMLPSQEPLYQMEKLCVAATRWMERCRIPIDRTTVAELIRMGQREWLPALTAVYDETSIALGRDIRPGFYRLMADEKSSFAFDPEDISTRLKTRVDLARAESSRAVMDPMEMDVGGKFIVARLTKDVPNVMDRKKVDTVQFPLVYDILNPDQLGLLMRELGVSGLTLTEKSGQIKTSKDVLDLVIKEAGDQFPTMAKVKRFREVAKALASNLEPIWEDTNPEDPIVKCPDSSIRVNFDAFKVETGRFSTPQPKEEGRFTGTVRWNLHSIPNTADKGSRPECMKHIREIVRARPGRKIVCVDYSGQELRVVTNLSGEHLWVTEFFRCGDCGQEYDRGNQIVPPPPEPPPPFCTKCGSDKIGDVHTLTAISIFGEGIRADKKVFKVKRGEGKVVNFALAYGGGGSAVVRATACSKEEGWRIKNQFDKTYKGLSGWWKSQVEFVKKTKHVLTAFNRRCFLPDIDSPMSGFVAKSERNAVNAPIQGCLGAGTLILTKTGIKQVGDLYANAANGTSPKRFDVWTGTQWSLAAPILSGQKRLQTTKFADGGNINTSPEHLFRVWDSAEHDFQWKRQIDLQIGDWVAKNLTHFTEENTFGAPTIYDYTRVVEKVDTGTYEEMYDIQVFDDEHAFVADGVVVHNTGADIMKLAMGLLYKEFKKRGWLYRVRPIITIHDEIVFEIEDGLLVDALPVIKEIMLKWTTRKLAWRVPLTCDIEIGQDWTVPWNYTEITHGHAEMPVELAPIFAPAIPVDPTIVTQTEAPITGTQEGVESSSVSDMITTPSPQSIVPTPTPTATAQQAKPAPVGTQPITLDKGEPYVWRIPRERLTMMTMNKVADVIAKCRGRGTHLLQVVTDADEPLWDGEDVFVNPTEVAVSFALSGH